MNYHVPNDDIDNSFVNNHFERESARPDKGMHRFLRVVAASNLKTFLFCLSVQPPIFDAFGAVHPLVVREVVLLAKRCLEVLDTLRTTALPSHFDCFLLTEHLTESTSRRHNCCAGVRTTLSHPQTELHRMVTLERSAALLGHAMTRQRATATFNVVANTLRVIMPRGLAKKTVH